MLQVYSKIVLAFENISVTSFRVLCKNIWSLHLVVIQGAFPTIFTNLHSSCCSFCLSFRIILSDSSPLIFYSSWNSLSLYRNTSFLDSVHLRYLLDLRDCYLNDLTTGVGYCIIQRFCLKNDLETAGKMVGTRVKSGCFCLSDCLKNVMIYLFRFSSSFPSFDISFFMRCASPFAHNVGNINGLLDKIQMTRD